PAARLAALPRRERLAVDELHRDEHLVAVLADLVDRHHVRMRHLRHRLRFAEQSRVRRRATFAGAHELDRDRSVELSVVRLEHDAHATFSEFPAHLEVPDSPTCGGRGARATGDTIGERRRDDLTRWLGRVDLTHLNKY